MYPRNWVEISGGALLRNLAAVQARLAPGVSICAVVKADAYGHGAVACAIRLQEAGVRWFAVTSVEEGRRLRAGGVEGRILVLAGFSPAEAHSIVEHSLTPAVWDPLQIKWLAHAAHTGNGMAPFPVHVKLDSGMGRLGTTIAQMPMLLAALADAPALRVEAVFSHFSSAEADDAAISHRQIERFEEARKHFTGCDFWHVANSAAALRFPELSAGIVRVGIALYGYIGTGVLSPALTWKTRVISVKELTQGHSVGYGARYVTSRPSRVATLAVGYADGYRRDLWRVQGPSVEVLLHGRRAPVIGAISMDLTTVDVTDIPEVALEDTATLVGTDGTESIWADELAAIAGTLHYEILCGISARVERYYRE